MTCNELSYLRGVKENTTILFGAMNTAGGSLKWFRDALYGGETPQNDAYPRINKEIEAGAKIRQDLFSSLIWQESVHQSGIRMQEELLWG